MFKKPSSRHVVADLVQGPSLRARPPRTLLSSSYLVAGKREAASSAPLLTFVGELDFSVAGNVRDVLQTLIVPCAIDLSQVPYLDVSIVKELLVVAKGAAPDRVTLIGPRPHVRRMLAIFELNHLFTFSDETTADGPRLIWKSGIY